MVSWIQWTITTVTCLTGATCTCCLILTSTVVLLIITIVILVIISIAKMLPSFIQWATVIPNGFMLHRTTFTFLYMFLLCTFFTAISMFNTLAVTPYFPFLLFLCSSLLPFCSLLFSFISFFLNFWPKFHWLSLVHLSYHQLQVREKI